MKARGVPSPNIADALCLTEYFANSATRVFAEKRFESPTKNYRDTYSTSLGWMA